MNRASRLDDRDVNFYVAVILWLAGVGVAAAYFFLHPDFADEDMNIRGDAVGVYAFLLLIAVRAGSFANARVGLGAPLVEALLRRSSLRAFIPGLLDSAAIGLAMGFLATLGALLGVIRLIGHSSASDASAVDWSFALMSVHAGVTEEILFRFGLLSLLAWVLGRWFFRRAEPARPAPPLFASLDAWFQPKGGVRGIASRHAMQAAAILSAIVFALAHVEQVSEGGLPDLGMRTLHGLVYGGLYVRHGLEAAIVAHASYDMSLSIVWNALT